MPLLNTCCFCISTRIGTIIIGALDLIGALIGIITSIVFLATWETTFQEFRNHQGNHRGVEALTIHMLIVLIIVLVVCIVHVVITSLLILGVIKMRPGLMLPFMFMSAISLILSVGINSDFTVRGGELIQGLSGIIVSILLGIYCLLVVYSHYQELRDRDRIADAPRAAQLKSVHWSTKFKEYPGVIKSEVPEEYQGVPLAGVHRSTEVVTPLAAPVEQKY